MLWHLSLSELSFSSAVGKNKKHKSLHLEVNQQTFKLIQQNQTKNILEHLTQPKNLLKCDLIANIYSHICSAFLISKITGHLNLIIYIKGRQYGN